MLFRNNGWEGGCMFDIPYFSKGLLQKGKEKYENRLQFQKKKIYQNVRVRDLQKPQLLYIFD